ncbi:MAG: 30S ribosomal protein S21 [Erysipelotrichaceae bacterium]|nr:30S ribosomal protein S21 [Erysipelotrichaceae bacterium]
MSVNVKNNNIDGALRILRTQSAPTLSAARDKKEYKKPGVRRREEQKKNTINSRKNSKKANNYNRSNSKKYAA